MKSTKKSTIRPANQKKAASKRASGDSRAANPEVLPAENVKKAALKSGTHDSSEQIEEAQWEESEATDQATDQAEDKDEEPEEQEILNGQTQGLRVPDIEITDSELRAVSPTDPLRRYMEEVKQYPLLGPEEEFSLALKLRDQGDIQAAKSLVQANLRLVVKIAFEYRSLYSNVLDLIQEGNIGLMKAVSKFDPTKGARLGYYASWWIRSYILKYLLDNFRLVKIGTTQAQKKLFYHLMREKERLEAQGLLAGPKLLAEKLNVREKDVIEMEQRLSGRGAEMSIDAPMSSDGDEDSSRATHGDFLVDSTESVDEKLARQQLIELIRDKLPAFEKSLNIREKQLLHDRLLAEEPKTLQEVADLYGLTRERARQIEAKVVSKLRDFLSL